ASQDTGSAITSEGKTMFRNIRQHLLIWTCSLIFAFTATAMSEPITTLHGTVADPSGAVVAHARVELLVHGIPVANVVTDGRGQYSISRKPGQGSRLRVAAAGFK